jgi:hypothetical protein
VVAVGVGQPDPGDVGRVDHLGHEGEEVPVGQPETGVGHDRLRGVDDERVDGRKQRPGTSR